MAVTAFWPVKGSLKNVVDYAENPDKTTLEKFVPAEDLAQVLRYVENDDKTEKKLFVTGINCDGTNAYEEMQEIKRRFGKLGGNVAYHGYQSFRPNEVTPEECHQIGIQTARRMFGNDYQVVVTTHLNTKSVHNHIVVNSVNFRTGRKFENHIRDHYRLREVSDKVCREHGLSVLENAPFYGSQRRAYWVHKAGKKTHRDLLKEDIEHCIRYSYDLYDFRKHMAGLGYTYDQARHSVKAPGWERAIRLDRLGYSEEVLDERIWQSRQRPYFYQERNENLPYRPQALPLKRLEKQLEFTVEHTSSPAVVVLDVMFLLLIQLLKLAVDERAEQERVRPLSPELRAEAQKLDEYTAMVTLMAQHDIHTDVDLEAFKAGTKTDIQKLEGQRQKLRNQIRRCSDPEREASLKEQCKAISRKLAPLRKELKIAEKIEAKRPAVERILETEKQMEVGMQRSRSKEYER